MQIKLSDHFTYRKLLRFAFPSIVMMVFTSIYGVVDGLFVSNFVGKSEFAAINLIMPFLMVAGALGFMIGTGGTALVAKTLGEGDDKRANSLFSMLIYITIGFAVVIGAVAFIFLEPISVLLGAEGKEMIEDCVLYGRIILVALPFFMLQNIFQSFLITAEKPKLGLYVTVAAGVANMVLDALLILPFNMGLAGAALATALSQFVGAIIPLIYFARKNNSSLRLTKFKFDGSALLRSCTNGSSEFVSNISVSVVNMLYNYRLMELVGEDGISAFGVIMYVQFIFVGIFYGFALAMSPVVGYHYGADNRGELKSLFRKSFTVIITASVLLTVLAEVCAFPLAKIFVGYDKALFELTVRAFMLYSLSYLLCGVNIFASAFFTALNNGFVSAVISFARTFLFQLVCLIVIPMVLPEHLKLDGIWLVVVVAEVLSLMVTAYFVLSKRKKYGYI